MEWVAYAVVLIVMTIVSYYASMRAQRGRDVSAEQPEQPTVNTGDRVPKLFGTRLITSPKTVWMGPPTTEAIKK